MQLPEGFEQKNYIQVNYDDLDTLIKSHYGIDYRTMDGLFEPHNDTYHTITVNGGEVDEADGETFFDDDSLLSETEQTIESMKQGEEPDEFSYPSPHAMLNMLNREGIVPAGEYLLTVAY
jgi:hypothetical protein